MPPRIPKSIKAEHDRLHARLVEVVHSGGETQIAARRVARVLHPHFLAEEGFAMPPLGILKSLLKRSSGIQFESAFPLAQRMERNLPRMLSEHKEIIEELKSLRAAAEREGKTGVKDFADELVLHTRTEEEVLYPAAILVGRYLGLVQKPVSKSAGKIPRKP